MNYSVGSPFGGLYVTRKPDADPLLGGCMLIKSKGGLILGGQKDSTGFQCRKNDFENQNFDFFEVTAGMAG